MSEAAQEATPEAPEATSTGSAEAATSTPPWGDDFSPETAWEALQKARREASNLRQRVGPTAEQQQQLDEYNRLVEASKSEQQRQSEALEAANRARDTAATEAMRYRVAIEHGIGKDDLGLLGNGTEEEMTANAQRLAALNAAVAAAGQAPPPPPGRPQESLKPGATPSTDGASDDDRFYESIYGQHTQ